MLVISIVGFVAFSAIVGVVFVNMSPQFGKGYGDDQKDRFAGLDNFENGKFVNQHLTEMDVNFFEATIEYFKNDPSRSPDRNIEVNKIDSIAIEEHPEEITYLTWFGHSAFLLEIDGKKILLDPMLGDTPAPHPLLGKKRYSQELPIEIEKLPFIDAIILSHDHYDHLDYPSIKKLKDKTGQFFVPLGLGSHLKSWGVPDNKIQEFNWWEATRWDGIQLVCTPARHFSGRGILDRNVTLWCSWVIQGRNHKIFFSGDSGYDDHFKEIGEKYGPFDISLLECGQYNEDWKAIHMMPEETVQAAIDLKSQMFIPIHWGAFTLAFHSWTDPVVRASKKAAELDMPMTTPRIGETIKIGSDDYPKEQWWDTYN